MARFHIGKDGLPGVCRAQQGKCPYGDDDEHYASKLEALTVAEHRLLAEADPLASKSKNDDELWHVGERGAAEECVYRTGKCKVRPYGKFNNTHTTDKAEVESIARGLRELQGDSGQVPPPPTPRVAPQRTPTVRRTPSQVAVASVGEATYNAKKAAGWTDKEIQEYSDSCGHSMPARIRGTGGGYNHC